MKKLVSKFYEQALSDTKIKSEIQRELTKTNRKEKTEYILNNIVLPIAKKNGYDFSLQDLVEYERLNMKENSSLDDESLLDVSGGMMSPKLGAICLGMSFGISSFGSLASSAAPPTTPTQSGIALSATQQTMSVDSTLNDTKGAAVKALKEDMKIHEWNLDLDVNKGDLHSIKSDEIEIAIKGVSIFTKQVARKLNSEKCFQELCEMCKSGKTNDVITNLLEKVKKDGTLSAREKVATNLIIDDWAKLNGFSHTNPMVASPFFVEKTGGEFWPEDNGFLKGTEKTNEVHNYKVGKKIDRYGSPEYGVFVAPHGNNPTPYYQRAMANRDNPSFFHIYEVTRDFEKLTDKATKLNLDKIAQTETEIMNSLSTIKDKINPSLFGQLSDGKFVLTRVKALLTHTAEEAVKSGGTQDDIEKIRAEFDIIKTKLDVINTWLGSELDSTLSAGDRDGLKRFKDTYRGAYSAGGVKDLMKEASVTTGKIAPAFKQKGGGTQAVLPLSVQTLIDFGFLKEV